MSTKMNRSAYEKMITENIARVEKEMVHSPERMHIIDILKDSPKRLYGAPQEVEELLAVLTGPPSEDETVRVTAADYNGKDWDGLPFSFIPEWLKEAIEQGIVSIEPSSTDYARWRVITVVGPGDQIVRASLASAPPEKRSDSQA